MKKRILAITTTVLFTCILSAQTFHILGDKIYTKDKDIPSYVNLDKTKEIHSRQNLGNQQKNLQKVLNLNDETTTLLADTLTDVAGGFHETYREYYKGVEVEGAKYTIHYNYEGRPLFANGNFKTIRNLNTIATISESEALQIALNHIGAKKYNWEDTLKESHLKLMMNDSQATYYPYGKFVIYIKNGVSHFTYKYRIDAILPELHLCIYVDASTGEIVDEQNMVCNISNIVSTLYSGSQTIETQLYSDRYRLRDYSRGNGVGLPAMAVPIPSLHINLVVPQ